MKQTAPQTAPAVITESLVPEETNFAGSFAVVGCDPGPTHSAFARVEFKDGELACTYAAYLPNRELLEMRPEDFARRMTGQPAGVFAYEKTANHGRVVGALVFDTCAASGMIRYLARASGLAVNAVYAISPSMWRYLTVGFGAAKDPDTKKALTEVLNVRDADRWVKLENARAKAGYGLTKPCTSHLRDAIGVAVAVFLGKLRLGPGGVTDVADTVWKKGDLYGKQV